eukprot:jgi/Botrbrau1/22225/Bobra.168_1s0056.1
MAFFKKIIKNKKPEVQQPKRPRGTATTDAIHQLHETIDLLEKKHAYLEKRMDREMEQAREYTKAKNKKGALQALKRKKAIEAQMQAVQNNIDRVNEQVNMLEGQGITVAVLESMAYASKVSKDTMTQLNVGEVDKVLDSITDQNEQLQQIQEAMAQPIGAAADLDEDELLSELEALSLEQLEEDLGEASTSAAPARTAVPPRIPAQAAPAAVAARTRPAAAPPQATRAPAAPAARGRAAPQRSVEEHELEALEAELAA